MVQIQLGEKRVTAKIVFYGPGMSGKTTNLEVIHERAPDSSKGALTSISTDGDRTLFFDFMPLDLGTVAGLRTRFRLYTVPGQVYYNSTRKLVLRGTDGVIFVADSAADMLEANLESLANLRENLAEYGKDLNDLPLVLQFNKRDLPNAMPVEDLRAALREALGGRRVPDLEAVANTGQGVFPTLKALAALVLDRVHQQTGVVETAAGPAAAKAEASMTPPSLVQCGGQGTEEPASISEPNLKTAADRQEAAPLSLAQISPTIPAGPQIQPPLGLGLAPTPAEGESTLRLGSPMARPDCAPPGANGPSVPPLPAPQSTPTPALVAPAFEAPASPEAHWPTSVTSVAAPGPPSPRAGLAPLASSVRPRSMALVTAAYVVIAFLAGIALGAFLAQPF